MENASEEQKRIRREVLPISKKFNQFVTLPNLMGWKVHDGDVLVRGRVLSYFRTKRTLLPDILSSLKMRFCSVTCHGFLVVYEDREKGLIVDLRAAAHVTTRSDKFRNKQTSYRRCHIKIAQKSGNAHLFLKDEEISRWVEGISKAQLSAASCPRQEIEESSTVEVEHTMPKVEEKSVEDISNVPEPSVDMEELDEASQMSTSTNSGLVTVIEKLPEKEKNVSEPIESVRRGNKSVRSIRKKLEKTLVLNKSAREASKKEKKPEKFVSSIFIYQSSGGHQLVPTEIVVAPDTPLESERKKSQREWWTKSLRC